MLDKELLELVQLQLNRAKEIIEFIPEYIEIGDYNTAVNRSYYAAFHSIKAIELIDGFDSKKHSGVIAFFRQNYIKTNIFDSKYSDIIGALQEAREDSDYNLVVNFDIDEAKEYFELTKDFVNVIENYLNEKLK